MSEVPQRIFQVVMLNTLVGVPKVLVVRMKVIKAHEDVISIVVLI